MKRRQTKPCGDVRRRVPAPGGAAWLGGIGRRLLLFPPGLVILGFSILFWVAFIVLTLWVLEGGGL